MRCIEAQFHCNAFHSFASFVLFQRSGGILSGEIHNFLHDKIYLSLTGCVPWREVRNTGRLESSRVIAWFLCYSDLLAIR